jgi:hypothetical protein
VAKNPQEYFFGGNKGCGLRLISGKTGKNQHKKKLFLQMANVFGPKALFEAGFRSRGKKSEQN